ncbi:hypothetical protein [Alkalicoccobacillus gibsonii]|uniref:hypothetical protein n=1 Tax=Alkalicoccobacillus gibsonii TaxID=79881 RepID=UPI0035137DD2
MKLTRKIPLVFLSFIMVMSFVAQPIAEASSTLVDENSDFEEVNAVLNQYITYTDTGMNFDVQSAKDAGESEFVLQTGTFLNELESSYNPDPNEIVMFAKLPVWGNWCGPGHGGGATKDYLDAACKQHDLDYAKHGYFHCVSDMKLIARIQKDYSKMKFTEKAMARAVQAYFTAQIGVNC